MKRQLTELWRSNLHAPRQTFALFCSPQHPHALLLGLKMPASIKIGYLPSYTASNLVSMEGFCILWAGKLVIGSAVSSCAKCRQETKMWTLVIGSSLSGQDQLILAARRNGIVTIRDDIWERGGISRIATNPFRFTLNSVSLRLPSIHLETPAPHQNHVPSHILSIGVRKRSIGSTTIKAHRWKSKPADEMNEKLRKHDNQMKWTKMTRGKLRITSFPQSS